MSDLDRDLILDSDTCAALIAARKAKRAAQIDANVAARKAARLAAAGKLTDATKAEADKTAALATAANHQATIDATVTAAKTAHAATDLTPTDEGYDPHRGAWCLRFEARLAGQPPVEKKRKPMSDADADAFAASYKLACAAADELADIRRQLDVYREANNALFDALPPGAEPPPVDPAYEALKVEHDKRLATVQTEQAKQGTLVEKYLAGEAYTYCRIDIADGSVVLGDVAGAKETKKEV